MVLGVEVTQGVLQGEHFLLVGEDVFALRRMVNSRVVRFDFRQFGRNTCQNLLLKCVHDI